MKRVFPWTWIILICLLTSCSKSGWTDRSGPVGVMYLDGKEFREAGSPNLVLGYFYGMLGIVQQDNSVRMVYSPNSLSNRLNTIRVELSIIIDDVVSENYEGGSFHYSMGDGNNSISFALYQKRNVYEYDIIEADVQISNLVCDYSDEDYSTYSYHCRIDYSMDVVDSEGKAHKVEGWAKHDDLRDKV